ncbi:hypothetical protein GVX81_08750 [[Haemophilus] felis]|uniref:Uncharacterized protein n=1 Tax=[Haemophilus] felis TaxID=123822 RepID=A0A1T0AYF8_9PAST|nr:hypothetical protein [[Haemophilus] felis]OOS02491.1 hypothetical protein B0188_08700 [[Haemophilus] felis]
MAKNIKKQIFLITTETLLSFIKEVFIILIMFSLCFSTLVILTTFESSLAGLDKETIFSLLKASLLFSLTLFVLFIGIRTITELGGGKWLNQ